MSKNVSRMITAFDGWKESLQSFSNVPKGMFGRVAIIKCGNVEINLDELDFEVETEFDDNVDKNEGTINIYNLAKTTIQELKQCCKDRKELTITAGYKGDTGVIFKGVIIKVYSKSDELDTVTTLYLLDTEDAGGGNDGIKDKTYKKGTKASYILKDLIGYLDLPLAVFSVRRDHVYKDEVKVNGEIWEEIKKQAEVCGISVYVNNRMIYARHLSEGDNINFTVSAETGLIGSPEEFYEDIETEDYTETIHGYKVKMLLQHRMTTAAIINLNAKDVSGQFRVRAGKHIINESEATTEIEVIG